MSVESVIETIGGDVTKVWDAFKSDYAKAKAIWNLIRSPQTWSVLVALGKQAVTTFGAAESAVGAEGTSLPLDATLIADIKALWADAKAGDAVIVADLKALGITL
jgi:hypothetical protein